MCYTASHQACHRSNPLREKSGPSRSGIRTDQGNAGEPTGGALPSLSGCVGSLRRRAMGGWTTERSCPVPPAGPRRNHSLATTGPECRHLSTDITNAGEYEAGDHSKLMECSLQQQKRPGVASTRPRLSTSFTRGEKSLINATYHFHFAHSTAGLLVSEPAASDNKRPHTRVCCPKSPTGFAPLMIFPAARITAVTRKQQPVSTCSLNRQCIDTQVLTPMCSLQHKRRIAMASCGFTHNLAGVGTIKWPYSVCARRNH